MSELSRRSGVEENPSDQPADDDIVSISCFGGLAGVLYRKPKDEVLYADGDTEVLPPAEPIVQQPIEFTEDGPKFNMFGHYHEPSFPNWTGVDLMSLAGQRRYASDFLAAVDAQTGSTESLIDPINAGEATIGCAASMIGGEVVNSEVVEE